MSLALIIIGLILWLLGFGLFGIILLIIGLVMLFAPYPYGYPRRR